MFYTINIGVTMTCSFTGHRPNKLQIEHDDNDLRTSGLKAALKKEIIKKIENGTDTFMSGMALGIDLIAAEAVIELKKIYPHIKLTAVIPFRGLCSEMQTSLLRKPE